MCCNCTLIHHYLKRLGSILLVIICQTLTTAAGDLEGMLADIVANPLPLEKVYLLLTIQAIATE